MREAFFAQEGAGNRTLLESATAIFSIVASQNDNPPISLFMNILSRLVTLDDSAGDGSAARQAFVDRYLLLADAIEEGNVAMAKRRMIQISGLFAALGMSRRRAEQLLPAKG